MNHAKRCVASAACLIAAVSTGCTPSAPTAQKPDWVSRQWAESMATYNILPIYPPTEDVHVGDIYAYRLDSEGVDGNLFRSMKFDYVPMQTELEEYYGNVPVMPETSDEPASGKIWRQAAASNALKPSATLAAAPASDAKHTSSHDAAAHAALHPAAHTRDAAPQAPQSSVFKPTGTMDKLSLIAFPGFNLAHADVESLAASVPLRFFHAIFGASRRAEGSISIKVAAAETYGVPVVPAFIQLKKYCATQIGQIACTAGFIRRQLRSIGDVTTATPVAISMINRLYLARSIEYTYEASTAVGAQADLYVTLQRALDNQQALLKDIGAKAASAVAVAGASAPAETTAKLADIKAQLDALLQQIQATNQQFGNSPVPGVSFTVGRMDAQGVSLIQTFERPIAIGYRAVAIPALQ
ncbi:hypothetical protein [Paraburkholderia sp. 22B1P]|uniref:hypothetical protein n=1 Tax=Paraburkholderia sp. 22B1P TaxID=3080498 RepID=UPI00308D333E|nr:hypothetical protein PBP221_01320 [Paraburkholderia sp. 22B1P]